MLKPGGEGVAEVVGGGALAGDGAAVGAVEAAIGEDGIEADHAQNPAEGAGPLHHMDDDG